ncbi:MAG: LexA family transcriptional regulator [Ruminococcus sp.]|nr:LexA family transcriptional regulator [Ruminococcus sp.]
MKKEKNAEFCQNLAKLRKEKGLKMKDVAISIGANPTTYRKYESGDLEPGFVTLVKLADFYNISTDVLLGRTMYDRTDLINQIALAYRLSKSQKGMLTVYLYMDRKIRETLLDGILQLADGVHITKKDAPVVARFFQRHINQTSAEYSYDLENSDNWETVPIVDCPEANEADFIVVVDDDSMEPTFHNGDNVFVKLAEEVLPNHIGLFRLREQAYIKRYGENCLLSDNPDYPSIFASEDESITCIGTVIGLADVLESSYC